MTDPGLAQTSDTLFWVALIAYAAAMLMYFASLAYRARRASTIATVLAAGGLAVHAASLIARGMAAGRVPWGNMFEYSSTLGFLLVAVYLFVVQGRLGLRQVGGFAMGAAILALATARLLYAPAGPLQPALDSYWLRFHVIAAILGSTLFGTSFIFTALYAVRARAEGRLSGAFSGSTVGAAYVGPPPTIDRDEVIPDLAGEAEQVASPEVRGILGALPTASRLDLLAYRTVQFAFPVWTFAVIAGAIWAHEAWGRYWGWDPKETWAFVTWVIYAGYLHARATAGWRAGRAAVINAVGFVSVLFTYFAVNLLIDGLHSYSGV